jgi:uncharacterized protein YecA (UPF0149 family)
MTQESMALKQKIIEMQNPSNHYVQEREKTITSLRNAPQIKVTKVGRNGPCPCGSGKRFKKCCG